MRVTFITHYSDLFGANRSLLNLIDGLREMGVESSVITRCDGPMLQELEQRGVPFCIIPFQWWLMPARPFHTMKGVARLLFNMLLLPAMVRQVKRWKPDIIYTNSSVVSLGAFTAKLTGKPHVWHVREFGKLDYQLRHDLGEVFFRFWMNQAYCIIAISKSIREVVLKGVRKDIHVVYNGVISNARLEKMSIEQDGRQRNEIRGFTFVIAGKIHPNKGHEEAVEAFALTHRDHPETELLIVGSGEEDDERHLHAVIEKLGISPHVRFLGFVDDIFPVFDSVDAVLMCSSFEAMGRVTAEAMAAGKPVIGHDSAGTAELIEHGKTGLLYKKGKENLAACMERLIENPELARDLGAKAREKARREYTVETYAGKIFAILQSVQQQNTLTVSRID